MAISKKPVTGMKDILPEEMRVRDYVIRTIKETYSQFGFTSIETPCVESIGNLTSKQGGDNEKLIFRIMKRGEKLKITADSTEADLADSGLRYDLTVPLARYYANNASVLPSPFKALQIGPVFRADRPQRGRFRQFYQCDIDILGEAGNLAEIELILATTTTLSRVGFSGFTVRINDRRSLKAMAAREGFPEEGLDQVFIILDKMDKIGPDGVKAELIEAGYGAEQAESYLAMLEKSRSEDGLTYLAELLGEDGADGGIRNLIEIREGVGAALGTAAFDLVFDPTLVRGMSYYTGTIFEIEMAELGSSVAGGGRYDEMVGQFAGTKVPACGFSIGFERIITILLEKGFTVPEQTKQTAFLIEKGTEPAKVAEILAEAGKRREAGERVLVSMMKKNKKFQKDQLAAEGYQEIVEFFRK